MFIYYILSIQQQSSVIMTKTVNYLPRPKISSLWPTWTLPTPDLDNKDNKKGINLLSGFQSPVKIGEENNNPLSSWLGDVFSVQLPSLFHRFTIIHFSSLLR